MITSLRLNTTRRKWTCVFLWFGGTDTLKKIFGNRFELISVTHLHSDVMKWCTHSYGWLLMSSLLGVIFYSCSFSGPFFPGAGCRINLFSASKYLLGVISHSLSDQHCILIFSSFRLSSFNQPPHGLFMDLMEPQIFMRWLIYGRIKDGCFPFDERGLI